MAAHGCASLLLLHLQLAWRRSATCMCPRLLAGSPALHALCTDSSVYERLCSARAAKGDSLHDLLAARGRAAVLLPPGQRLFASGNTFLDDIRCDCQRSNSRPHIHARPMHVHAWPSHYRSPLLTLLSRALSQRLASVSDVSSGSGSDGTAARGLCVCVCLHCRGSSSQRFRQRKPRSISLKSARMRAKTPKFSLALRGVASRRDAAKKS